MKLSFFGAAGEVTGSCYLLEAGGARVLIDCGLFQGSAGDLVRNARALPFDPRSLDAMVVTHAHLDHTGRLPIVVREGFGGPVWSSRPTVPLTDLLLRDAAELQAADVRRRARARGERGCPPGRFCEPLFVEQDVARLVRQMRPVALEQDQRVAPGVSVRFVDSGHIIGSASVVVTANEGGRTARLVFSGDIGNPGTPILRDPIAPSIGPGGADVVVLESTYGDRDHKPIDATIDELVEVVSRAWAEGGKVLIPSFAVGRTQTLIYHFARLQEAGRLPNGLAVLVDTPLGIEATKLYEMDASFFDQESRALMREGHRPLQFPGLRMLRTGQESQVVNTMKGCAVVIAGAGMCTGGRIVHHLLHHLSDARTHVVIAGYQAHGTLGRRLVDREKFVRIMGQGVEVRAQVHTMGGFSAHGGQSVLVKWAQEVLGQCGDDAISAGAAVTGGSGAGAVRAQPRVMLTHGERGPRMALAGVLRERLGVACELPGYGAVVEV